MELRRGVLLHSRGGGFCVLAEGLNNKDPKNAKPELVQNKESKNLGKFHSCFPAFLIESWCLSRFGRENSLGSGKGFCLIDRVE
jgi:hypothetical protein